MPEIIVVYHTYSFNYKWFMKMNESMILVFLLIEKIFFSDLLVIL